MRERPKSIDYAPGGPRKRWWQRWWTIIPVILISLFLAYLALLPLLIRTIM
ncbi:MAG TPA: hypothetical protein VG269_28845 [Tepidisphaeraceae bacterium]|jgi:hypothetical protein|nr:hypothetical protein [Tepidisphaeraceae bacterium]